MSARDEHNDCHDFSNGAAKSLRNCRAKGLVNWEKVKELFEDVARLLVVD
jgi:hypothetical protein